MYVNSNLMVMTSTGFFSSTTKKSKKSVNVTFTKLAGLVQHETLVEEVQSVHRTELLFDESKRWPRGQPYYSSVVMM